MGEVKTAQAAHQQVLQELAAYKDTMAKVAEIATEVGSYDSQLKSIAGDMLSKGAQIEKLAASFREVAVTLKMMAKSPPNS